MKLHTVTSTLQVTITPGVKKIVVKVLDGPNAGKEYEGDNLVGAQVGQQMQLLKDGKLLCKSSTIRRIEM